MAADNNEKDFLDIDLDEPLDLSDDVHVTEELAAVPTKMGKTGEGILLFDNKRYAVGLTWLIAEEEGDDGLAKRRAKDFKADFYALRQGVVTQHGFGYLHKGHRLGQSSLASVAADALVGEWHGVFVADNGWWYVAVHADNLAPDGDILFASEEAAYNHFIAQNELYKWPRIYAPESWNIQDSTGEIPLSKVIGEAPAPALKPVNLDAIFSGKRNKNLAVGGLTIILALVIVSVLGQQLLTSLVPIPAQIPAPNLDVGENIQAPPKEPDIVREERGESLTKLTLVQPSWMMGECLNGFSIITLPVPGWKLTTLHCKDTFVEGSWTRQSGSYEMVEPYLARFPEGVARSFADSATLVATRRLTGKKTMMEPGELFERNYAIITLNKRFGELGQLDVKEVTPAASQQLLQGIEMMQQAGFSSLGQNKVEIRPLTRDDLPYLQIQLRTKTPPNMIGKYFDMPGLIVQNVANDVPGGLWQYDAKLILQPDNRLIEANTKAKALQQVH